jgi:uncharacterized phage protein (TIGR02218 family)
VRRIPALLLDHLQETVTTTCRLLKLQLLDGRVFGLTTLDRNIDYLGVTYYAVNGFNASSIATNAGLSVDNSDINALLADTEIAPGITFAMAAAGELDNARWTAYLINWADVAAGAMILDAGDIGQVVIKNGLVYSPELISFAMRLRQTIGSIWSLSCRATFGTEANSQTGCGYDAEALWVDCIVTAVDPDDPMRIFADHDNIMSEMGFPARVRWTTGNNAAINRLYQVEAYSSVSGTVALFEPVPFAIEVGDEYRIRRDCNKSPSMCLLYGNYINYKGEPGIPVGDGIESRTPLSQIFGSLNGSTISG